MAALIALAAVAHAAAQRSSARGTTRLPPAAVRHLLWHDEFNGPAGASPDPAKWTPVVGGAGWGNHELETYTDLLDNAQLDGMGDVVLAAHAQQYTNYDGIQRDYTSARLATDQHFAFRYGLMEARIRIPAGRGILPAFWALEQSPPPGSDPAEIDAMEVIGSSPRVLYGTLHGPWPWAPTGVERTLRAPLALSAGFHVYGVWWTPRQISFLLDGRLYARLRPADLRRGSAWPFRDPYSLILDVAVGGDWPGPPDATTPLPAAMTVDWVRVWQ